MECYNFGIVVQETINFFISVIISFILNWIGTKCKLANYVRSLVFTAIFDIIWVGGFFYTGLKTNFVQSRYSMKKYTVDMAASESQKESHKNICTVFYTAAISTEKNQQTNDSILKFFISCESHI
jgi:hypothetical protein